jgi:hypothetical protein
MVRDGVHSVAAESGYLLVAGEIDAEEVGRGEEII